MVKFFMSLLFISLLFGSVAYPVDLQKVDAVDRSLLQIDRDTVPHAIEKVDIINKSVLRKMEDSPFAVETINLKESYGRSGDVGELLNRASGVKVRNDGNIGTPVQINLGGLQGKAVRLFRDGIPIELFGHSFSLSTLPINMLDRVEVYKGAMPLYLAADALGGGVNLVSRKEYGRFAEFSYEVASFHTHRATVHIMHRDDSQKWYVGTNSSFNYSANDYAVHVPFYDMETNATTYQNSRRFHDAARAHYVEGFLGFNNRSWADDLRVTLIQSAFYKEIQHDAEMNKVYGEPYSKEKNFTGLLQYKKSLLQDRVQLDLLGAYSAFDTHFVDTSTRRYTWDGQVLEGTHRIGEINLGNHQQIDYRFLSTRAVAAYRLSENHHIDFSYLYNRQHRIGSDPLGAISPIEHIDVLTVLAIYQKSNMALDVRSTWWDDALESIFAIKRYHFDTRGYTTDNTGVGWRSNNDGQQWGVLSGLRWSSGDILSKLSYEYASRLPDEYEIFGDGRLTKENMDLQPEKSHNINLNGQYRTEKYDISTGFFYRKVRDIIVLQLDIPFSRYINYEHALIKGVEIEGNYRPFTWSALGLNMTYQDVRRVDIEEAMFRNMEGSRVPNIPFFFGNAWVNLHWEDLWMKSDRIEMYWNANYTHRFFLYAISKTQEPGMFEKVKDIQTSLIIPRDGRLGQYSHDVGVSYRLPRPKMSVSLTCRNVGDAKLYDNFSIQRPGRSFHLKIVYNL